MQVMYQVNDVLGHYKGIPDGEDAGERQLWPCSADAQEKANEGKKGTIPLPLLENWYKGTPWEFVSEVAPQTPVRLSVLSYPSGETKDYHSVPPKKKRKGWLPWYIQ